MEIGLLKHAAENNTPKYIWLNLDPEMNPKTRPVHGQDAYVHHIRFTATAWPLGERIGIFTGDYEYGAHIRPELHPFYIYARIKLEQKEPQ